MVVADLGAYGSGVEGDNGKKSTAGPSLGGESELRSLREGVAAQNGLCCFDP